MNVGLESRFFSKLSSIRVEENYAIAVSGGVDSITLMKLVSSMQALKNVRFSAVLTVNHGFRKEAVDEVRFVKQQAEMCNLRCCILTYRGNDLSNKSQKVARHIRYSLLAQWCKENGVKLVLTAHTKDDQAETLLLRLERGSGIDGLVGMREWSERDNMLIYRPMLDFTRNEILEYATQRGLVWIEDPSNSSTRYRRTFYRNFIKESTAPQVMIERLWRTTKHMQRALSFIVQHVKAAVDRCVEFGELGYIVIKRDEYRSLHEEIALRVLMVALMAIGGKEVKPRYEKFSFAFNKVRGEIQYMPFTICGCKVGKYGDNGILIVREVACIVPVTPVGDNSQCVEWDNRLLLDIKTVPSKRLPILETEGEYSTLKTEMEDQGSVYLTPLGKGPIPEHLLSIHRDIAAGLPVLMERDKVLACPLQNYNMDTVPAVHIERALVRDRVFCLIFSQLDQ